MKRHSNRSLAITVAVAALAWLGGASRPATTAQAEGSGERSFTVSTDPEGIVLRAEYFNDGDESAVFVLRGDGRLTHESTKRVTREVYDRAEMQLDAAERERLVRLIVDHGLLECGPDCIDARCVPEDPNVRPPPPNCPGVELTLNLDSYKAPGELTPRTVQQRMIHRCAEWVVDACREIVEASALDALRRKLFGYRRTMWEGRRADLDGESEPSSRTTRQPDRGSPGQAGETASRAAEGERAFTLSTDPEEVVLEYSHPSRLGIVAFKLYGDGRLVYEPGQRDPSGAAPIEMHPGFLEQERLVRTVVDAGLLECGAECIEERCARLRGINLIPPTADCGSVTLDLNLESYQGPSDTAARPLQRRIHLHCPMSLVTYWCTEQELPEAQALRDLGRALYEYTSAAEEVAQ